MVAARTDTAQASGSSSPGHTVAPGARTFEHLENLGVTTLKRLTSPTNDAGRVNGVDPTRRLQQPDVQNPALRTSEVPTPDPSSTRLTTSTGAETGFAGLDIADMRGADHGNQSTFEPPDQGLCATSGVVLEIVNDAALAVYSDKGEVIVPPVAMNAFFGFPPDINRQVDPPLWGPFLTDPQCYFDTQSDRWFLTIGDVSADPNTGQNLPDTHIDIAVSQTADPTSTWALYRLDVNDVGVGGAPSNPGCPCFGDQPVIGADANGFYISTNELTAAYPFDYHGAQIYAMSKSELVSAAATAGAGPTVVHIDAGMVGLDPSFSVHPATAPPGAMFVPNTEYFLSDSFDTEGHQLVVWALTDSDRLNAVRPEVSLSWNVFATEAFTLPPNIDQRPGQAPLGTAVGEPLNQIRTDDSRMRQVQLSRGRLFAAIETGLAGGRVGVAWFIVDPSVLAGSVSASVERQGYVALSNDSLIYPAVGVTAAGRGVIAFGLAGPDFYPSAAYIDMDLHGVQGPVREIASGSGPEDGEYCYHTFVGSSADNGCPWGDYSAAVAENANTIVTGSEYITSRPRTTFANWGTFIGQIHV